MAFPKALLIDLDDTLFPERAYVESGFRAVAAFLEETRQLPADYSFPSMMAFLELEGRGAIFDRIIERFEIRGAEGLVEECVKVYRTHTPEIHPYEGVETTIESLREHCTMALVTNGHPDMQRRKLDALGLDHFFEVVIFCDAVMAPKPAVEGIELAISKLGASSNDCMFIGDNPNTDGLAAGKAGIPFLRVRTERFKSVDMATSEVSAFSEVPDYLSAHAHKMRL